MLGAATDLSGCLPAGDKSDREQLVLRLCSLLCSKAGGRPAPKNSHASLAACTTRCLPFSHRYPPGKINSQLQGEPSSLPVQAAQRSPTATGCSRGSSAGAFGVCFPGVGAKWGGLERYVWQLFRRRQSSTCCSSHPGAQGRGRGAGTEPPGAGEVRVPGWEGARRRSLVVEEGAGDAEAGARQEAAEAGSRRSPAG